MKTTALWLSFLGLLAFVAHASNTRLVECYVDGKSAFHIRFSEKAQNATLIYNLDEVIEKNYRGTRNNEFVAHREEDEKLVQYRGFSQRATAQELLVHKKLSEGDGQVGKVKLRERGGIVDTVATCYARQE